MIAIAQMSRFSLVAALLIGCPGVAVAGPSSLTVVARDGGQLLVSNSTSSPVRLNGSVVVEGFDGRVWKPLITEMNLVEACPADGIMLPGRPVLLSPGRKISPPAWRGWSCSGQCETHCRSNVYWGSGPFRFRLTAFAGTSYVTNSFRMAAQPNQRAPDRLG